VTEAEETTQVVEYSVTDGMIAEMKTRLADLEITDTKSYDVVKKAIAELRGWRVGVDKHRKELKADALAWGRLVQVEANRITTELKAIEDPLKERKQAVDDEKARVKAEKEEAERKRVEEIQDRLRAIREASIVKEGSTVAEIEDACDLFATIDISDELFQEFVPAAQISLRDGQVALEARLEERKKFEDEQEQLKKDRAELDAKLRVRDEEDAKREAEQREAQDKLDADRKALDDEKAELEADKQAKIEADEQIELDKKEAEDREARKVEVEKQRKADEEADAERQEALKPDREKMRAFAILIGDTIMQIPDLKDSDLSAIMDTISTDLEAMAVICHKA